MPRSSRMPSARSPARSAGISRKSAWTKRTRSPNSARRRAARASVSPSRSMPSRRPSGALRRRISAGVAAEAQGAVHVEAARPHREQLQRFVEQDGAMRPRHQIPNSERTLPSSSVNGSFLNSRSCEPLLVPDREVVLQAEDAHLARHGRGLAQQLGQHHAALLVHGDAAWPKKFTRSRKRSFEGCVEGTRGELALDLEPHRHRVEAHVLAGDAGDEQLRAPLRLDERAEPVRDLEPPLVVDARRMVAPKHVDTVRWK